MTLSGLAETLFDAIEKEGARAPHLFSEERGAVSRVLRGVVEVEGFTEATSDEVIAFAGGATGLAIDLVPGRAGIVLLHDPQGLRPGDTARRTRRVASVPTGEALRGRVINPLGRPLDGLGPVAADRLEPVERPAPAIMERAAVAHPLQTGIKAIDALVPIGRGQRELIVGDRQTGKTAVAVDTILNQVGTGVISVYCSIGQRGDAVARVIARLRDSGVMENCVVVVAGAEEPPGLQYIAPYAATTIAERFMRAGRNALIVYDDLTRHARTYRELSLLLRRPPGREAYPGDIFYLHARLLERATQLRESAGGGSLTALPIVETQAQNLSAYIPTNLISITDGQIYLSPALFRRRAAAGRGCRPLGLPRRRQGATSGLPCGGGAAEAGLRPVRGTRSLRPLRRQARRGYPRPAGTRPARTRGAEAAGGVADPRHAPDCAVAGGGGRTVRHDPPFGDGRCDRGGRQGGGPDAGGTRDRARRAARRRPARGGVARCPRGAPRGGVMATLEELSRHIEVAEDLQSVVRTMKTISAVAIRRHELAEQAMSRYLETVELGLQVALRALKGTGAGARVPGEGPTAVILVGSEIGLCGAFNERLVTFALESLAATEASPGAAPGERLVLTIGARADASWRAEAEPPSAHEEAPATVEALTRTVGAVLTRLDHWREEKGVGRLVLFHHRPGEGGRGTPVRARLLPLDPAWLAALRARTWSSRRLPVPAGPPEALFRRLIRQLLFARVFTAVIQSRTAEHAERLAAMQAADRSIGEKIDDLHMAHRRTRQSVITSELLDLVSGYEAIMGDQQG